MKATEARKRAQVVKKEKADKKARAYSAEKRAAEQRVQEAPAYARRIFKDCVLRAIEIAIAKGEGGCSWWLDCSDYTQPEGKAMIKLLEKKGYKVEASRNYVPSRFDDGDQMGDYWSTSLAISW